MMRIYGIHPVEELLKVAPDRVTKVYASDPGSQSMETIRSLVAEADALIEPAGDDRLDEMAHGGNHQGVVVEATPFQYVELDDLVAQTAEQSRACVVVLDQVQDPQNLGAILRSAAAMGVDGVVIPKDRAAGVTAAVVRASSGQAYRVPVAQITNVARTVDRLKEHGYWSVGADMNAGSQDVWDIDFDMKTALVIGSESQGIRRLVSEKCDLHARIPMEPGVESLNAAAAATVMFYEIRRQGLQGQK
ncbi:MAG: 23S rRNA (guanosine(2251)-2'-O)-methyltransferase RlmB [Myxococcota bacterium]